MLTFEENWAKQQYFEREKHNLFVWKPANSTQLTDEYSHLLAIQRSSYRSFLVIMILMV